MKASFAKIEGSTPNFRSFIAPGDVHCIIPRNEIYTLESGGTRLIDWITDMVSDKPVSSVACEGCAAP